MKTFVEFAAQKALYRLPKSEWLAEPGLRLYVRYGYIEDRHGDFVIANVNAAKPGKGALTAFLDKWEPVYRFSFENVINPRLREYLKRRDYAYESGPDLSPYMLKRK